MKRSRSSPGIGEPDVIIDFHLENGCFFLVVTNLGQQPAHAISTTFEPSFSGLGGSRQIPQLTLFDSIGFLPPGKAVRAVVDQAASYFDRDEPTVIQTEVSFEDDAGHEFHNRATHDLNIYRDLPHVTSETASKMQPNSVGGLGGGWASHREPSSRDAQADEGSRSGTFELYEDQAGEYRWRLVHPNGNIIADSGEGYTSIQKAKQGLASVQENAAGADVEDLT